jgi:hypothetical protein
VWWGKQNAECSAPLYIRSLTVAAYGALESTEPLAVRERFQARREFGRTPRTPVAR